MKTSLWNFSIISQISRNDEIENIKNTHNWIVLFLVTGHLGVLSTFVTFDSFFCHTSHNFLRSRENLQTIVLVRELRAIWTTLCRLSFILNCSPGPPVSAWEWRAYDNKNKNYSSAKLDKFSQFCYLLSMLGI